MSLRLRLALVFALGTAVVIAIAGLAFLGQLTASVNSALDSSLRARAHAVAAQLASGTLPLGPPAGSADGQSGNQTGQSTGTEDIVQVLTPNGTVLYPLGPAYTDPLLTRAQLRGVASGPVTVDMMSEGERLRIRATEVRHHARVFITVVGLATDIADAAQARALRLIALGGPAAILVAGLAAWLLTGAALRPVARLARRLDEITERDPSARLVIPSTRDEIASLAVTMNGLLERLQRALVRQRGLVADAGHELRTPLTALKAELQLTARPGKSKAALAAGVTAAVGDTDRLIRLAEDLLLLAEADEGPGFLNPARTEVPAVIEAAARGSTLQAQARGVEITVRTQEHLTAVADPDRLRQALDNMIDNAIRHAPEGSTVEVTSEDGERAADSRAMVAIGVRDHGPGFPPDFLPHAFERFRRADQARGRAEGGAGLGLAIVASIASAHGGRAVASNHPGGGALVRIELPVAGPLTA